MTHPVLQGISLKRVAHGFSLIELMIAVAIVGILASIAYPAYVDQIAKGKRSECRSGIAQTLQQQERYFSQFNTYVSISATTTTAVIKNFSGDNRASSACNVESTACTAPGNVALNACVEVRAILRSTDPANITSIYMDSDGRKGCLISTTRTTGNTACWP
jgi:type IV pilus assembly protein PilE